MKNMNRVTFLASVLFTPTLLVAAPVIDVGDFNLQENLAGQKVSIFVTGGDAVAALNFVSQVGQTDTATGQPEAGPSIEGVDLVTGTCSGSTRACGTTARRN